MLDTLASIADAISDYGVPEIFNTDQKTLSICLIPFITPSQIAPYAKSCLAKSAVRLDMPIILGKVKKSCYCLFLAFGLKKSFGLTRTSKFRFILRAGWGQSHLAGPV